MNDDVFTVHIAAGTLGVHGHDDQGAAWSTFEAVNSLKMCARFGKLITAGWGRSGPATEPMYICSEHVKVVYDPRPGETFTTGSLAYAAGTSERAMCKLPNDAGMTPRLDEYSDGPGEAAREVVIDLVALRAGDRLGRKLGALLAGTM
jgi:hypothetical protein